MLFEIIDPKQECNSLFIDNQITSNFDKHKLSKTWSYHSVLKNLNIEYASLYAQNKNIDQCCPDKLRNEWEQIKNKHQTYMKAFEKSYCDTDGYCFYDLLPESFVIEFYNIKNKITEHVINNFDKPSNYDFLFDLQEMVYEISQQKINIELTELNKNMHETKTRSFAKKIHNNNWKIDYNIFGTITGRLSTKKNSFPILTMSKDYRKIVKPKNDWFIELDFNAAELRCLLALNEKHQPEQDIHEWHQKIINNLSDQEMSRDDIKRKIFSWLYGPLSVSLGIPQIEKYYDKQYCLNKYWNRQSEIITNPFGREIKADEFHALNALIQSTTSDMFLRRAIAVNKILQSKKSFTMALIHDSMVIDFAKEDKNILEDIIDVFGDTEFGKFKSNVSLGTHFGNMRKFR